jgi:hypothetical protein
LSAKQRLVVFLIAEEKPGKSNVNLGQQSGLLW